MSLPPAGPELDILVAEKVMGLESPRIEAHGYASFIKKNGESRWRASLPTYSTTMRWAWEIIDKLANGSFSDKYFFIEELKKEMVTDVSYAAGLDGTTHHGIAPEWWLFFLTPEKICRAALRAVERT